jgi:hypothetical protein
MFSSAQLETLTRPISGQGNLIWFLFLSHLHAGEHTANVSQVADPQLEQVLHPKKHQMSEESSILLGRRNFLVETQ